MALLMPKCSRDIGSGVKKEGGRGGGQSKKINEIGRRKSL